MKKQEKNFSDSNRDARFDRVNEMEKRSTTENELGAFAKSGKLKQ